MSEFPKVKYADPESPVDREAEHSRLPRNKAGPGHGRWPYGIGVLVLLIGPLGYGSWRDYTQRRELAATAQQRRDTVADVVVGTVHTSGQPST
jgi:hypothetical protein